MSSHTRTLTQAVQFWRTRWCYYAQWSTHLERILHSYLPVEISVLLLKQPYPWALYQLWRTFQELFENEYSPYSQGAHNPLKESNHQCFLTRGHQWILRVWRYRLLCSVYPSNSGPPASHLWPWATLPINPNVPCQDDHLLCVLWNERLGSTTRWTWGGHTWDGPLCSAGSKSPMVRCRRQTEGPLWVT